MQEDWTLHGPENIRLSGSYCLEIGYISLKRHKNYTFKDGQEGTWAQRSGGPREGWAVALACPPRAETSHRAPCPWDSGEEDQAPRGSGRNPSLCVLRSQCWTASGRLPVALGSACCGQLGKRQPSPAHARASGAPRDPVLQRLRAGVLIEVP